MDCSSLKQHLLEDLSSKLYCSMEGDTCIVVSPFVTIEGDMIEFRVRPLTDGTFLVSDFGESVRHLAAHGIEFEESLVRMDYIQQVETTLGVDFDRSRLSVVAAESEVADAVWRVIEASRFVTDMVYTARPREEYEFKERVREALRLDGGRVDANVELKGQSGKVHRVDYRLVRGPRDLWIEAIGATRRSTVINQINAAYVKWADSLPSVRRLSIVDDTTAITPEDYALLSTVSKVVTWHGPEDLREPVKEALAGSEV